VDEDLTQCLRRREAAPLRMLNTLANQQDGKKWIPVLKLWPLRPGRRGGFTIDDSPCIRR
jgi:hypothetical protein